MVKNGTTQQVNTRHQVISAMKQYEGKSFEVGLWVFQVLSEQIFKHFSYLGVLVTMQYEFSVDNSPSIEQPLL